MLNPVTRLRAFGEVIRDFLDFEISEIPDLSLHSGELMSKGPFLLSPLCIFCILLLLDLSMSLVFINRICKHNRITLASTKHSPGALQIIGFPRSFRLVSTAINKDNLKTDFFVVLNNGQRGILRGNPKGGWYSIAVQDEHTGIETVSVFL